MDIIVVTNPEKIDADILSRGIVDFNRAQIPDLEPNEAERKFFVFAKDEADRTVGGIRGSCYWNTLHIELLWLSEDCRGTGVGRKMIASAENFAIEQKCEKALVETTSWQAKPFYEKNGYTHMATLAGRPKGHASHYLAKDLIAATEA